jgi:hypothetical protein
MLPLWHDRPSSKANGKEGNIAEGYSVLQLPELHDETLLKNMLPTSLCDTPVF